MILQYASDLHLEFPDNTRYLAENPMEPVGDVLVLCGDIDCLGEKGYPDHPFWDWASAQYEKVFVVPGNHEFYHGYDLANVTNGFCCPIRTNVVLCHNRTELVGDVEFVLSTLWSRVKPSSRQSVERYLNDYRLIKFNGKKLTVEISNKLHLESVRFLEEVFAEKPKNKRIVVTHHVPSFECMSDEFKGSILNDAFVSDLNGLIVSSNADAWIYGHSHRNIKTGLIGQTTMLSNQLGYVNNKEHYTFNKSCSIYI